VVGFSQPFLLLYEADQIFDQPLLSLIVRAGVTKYPAAGGRRGPHRARTLTVGLQ